ncbi:MAG TPA: hypothetical protein VMC48_03130 [Methanobacterium sp.]|nr:hypothetical protein [Methanobacterium sp.]
MKIDRLNNKYLKIDDIRSLIIFIICMGILIGIPVYWFVFVPSPLESKEINQSSYTATGYFAPGGYFKLEMNLGKESILGYHNGLLNVAPNITTSQNESLWQPVEMRVDEWPGSKTEIKYSSNNPINQEMILTVDRIDIPNSTELKGKTVPITVKYTANYPSQNEITEILGGTITNFDLNTEVFEQNITVKLDNRVITSRDLEVIGMNESWKKELSLIIWIIDFLIILLVFTKLIVVEKFNSKVRHLVKRILERLKKL